MTDSPRVISVFTHPSRPEAVQAARDFIAGLASEGIACRVTPELLDDFRAGVPQADIDVMSPGQADVELVVVFGGDGSILRAAEWAHPLCVPLLGVNLGHVGFLAELESSQMHNLVEHVVQRSYQVERRLTLQVTVSDFDGNVLWESFAVNEVSLEKTARERMLEILCVIDGRPLSQWSCDGVLVSTPSGSTAYAFSAGGPVMWPDLEAIEVVTLSAHALFVRPLVLSPRSRVELDLVPTRQALGVVWCDGRRTTDVGPGQRVTVDRSEHDLLIARLSEQPFTTRLVKKFGLRIEGWRAVQH
ncbi:MAG TPA: NAD kinase [Propionibacteriaceae bacterium]|nr:NAD kinase [Propionibacteriaceae bacterium]